MLTAHSKHKYTEQLAESEKLRDEIRTKELAAVAFEDELRVAREEAQKVPWYCFWTPLTHSAHSRLPSARRTRQGDRTLARGSSQGRRVPPVAEGRESGAQGGD